MTARLIYPILGLTKIKLIRKVHYKWIAELIDAELMIEVGEDDFILDKSEENVEKSLGSL